jgi:hypothetical protein
LFSANISDQYRSETEAALGEVSLSAKIERLIEIQNTLR